jgi:uncharacterized protein (TIGR02147 family)
MNVFAGGRQSMTEEGYRERLKGELHRRQVVNPRYSLRAFADALGISPAFLSKVFAGQKNLSLKSAANISESLGYSRVQAAEFCRLVQVASTRSEKAREILSHPFHEGSGEATAFTSVGLEVFNVMSDWYHYAILELSTCRGFKSDPDYIARKLKITASEAEAAVSRLVALKLLKNERGRLKKTDKFITTPSDQPNTALRNFHAQMMSKAAHALTHVPVEKREVTGLTLAISQSQLPVAKAEIRKFLVRLSKLLDTDAADQVVQLNLQLFALSEITNEERK